MTWRSLFVHAPEFADAFSRSHNDRTDLRATIEGKNDLPDRAEVLGERAMSLGDGLAVEGHLTPCRMLPCVSGAAQTIKV